jgi:hypothetical protein
MPGDANQMLRIVTTDFQKRLRRGHNLDQPAVLQHQRVATAQRHRIFEVQQKFESARRCHRHSPPVAIVEIEHDGIGWWFDPAVESRNFRGADHFSQYMK